jgi:hypothetical protein
MIVLNLGCRQNHRFEGWFSSAQAFEDQLHAGLVVCPFCADVEISRLPSGSRYLSGAAQSVTPSIERPAENPPHDKEFLKAFVDAIRNSEDVGWQFADEARRIHYREAEERPIRGKATGQDALDLLEEGIVVLPAPIPPTDETH